MSVISGFPVTRLIAETYLQHIEDVLFIAGEYGGKAFGSFIRDTIVPRTINPSCNISFNIVSLWFTTTNNARLFIENMLSKETNNYDFKEVMSALLSDIMKGEYGVSGQRYNLYLHRTQIAAFDIIIGEILPINDLNVNCLTYLCKADYSTGDKIKIQELQAENEFEKDQLIEDILNKEATLSVSYAERAVNDQFCVARIDTLINTGWTINVGGSRLRSPVLYKEQLLNILESNRKSATSSLTATVEEQETNATLQIINPSLNDTLEHLIRTDPLVKEAIAKIVAKMICESANAIESSTQDR